MKDVVLIMSTSVQNFFSFGIARCFTKTINPRIKLAIVNRIARERSGGNDSRPIFTAAHDDPQMMQMMAKPSKTFSRCDIRDSIISCCYSRVDAAWFHFPAIFSELLREVQGIPLAEEIPQSGFVPMFQHS